MLYISNAHKPSATLQSLVLPDFLPTSPCLALVHHTSISFLALPGNQHASTSSSLLDEITIFDINARILAVQSLAALDDQKQSQNCKRLLVLTDHYNPRLIVLIHNGTSITTESNLSLNQVARAPAELGLDLLIEPSSFSQPRALGQRLAAAHTHTGLLRILPISSNEASRKGSTTSSKRRTSRTSDINVTMDDIASDSSTAGKPETSQAFGVRLPHPTLISSAFLHPADASANPALALLSLSSVPSRIPGLGQQCLPVLSFHSINQPTQELLPIPWGPSRHPPAPAQNAASSSSQGDGNRPASNSQSMPGSFSEQGDEASRSKEDKKKQAKKKHGPSALGDRLDQAGLQQREEKWAKSALTRAHVPLPYVDALGAHLIHTIPAKAGGGVIIFSETSILYVSPPTAEDTRAPAAAASFNQVGLAVQGKRKKASTSENSLQARRAVNADAAQSPSESSSRSNENGKRRRSSAAIVSSPPTSPTSTRGGGRSRTRLLRTSLPLPVQIVAAATIIEADGSFTADDGQGSATLNVLFACSSGSLNLLKLRLTRSQDDPNTFQPVSLTAESLGAVPQAAGPNALTYLGESFVQVSSATGDAVLYRIEPNEGAFNATENDGDTQMITPPSPPRSMPPPTSFASFADASNLPTGGRLEEVHRWCNLGPIVDFAVDDGSGGDPASSASAQARIVTCSGSGPTGSLRVVRSGVGVSEMVELDIQNASKVWSVHSGIGRTRTTTLLVLSYITSNSFVAFQPDGSLVDMSAAVASAGLSTDLPILAVSSIESANGSTVFAVADRQQVVVVSIKDGAVQVLAAFVASNPPAIVTAAVNQHGQALLSLSDRSLVYLQFNGSFSLDEVTRIQLNQETSCLDISPLQSGQPAKYGAVGFWGTKSTQIYTLPELKPVAQSSFSETKFSSLPRSIALHQFESSTASTADRSRVPHLLVGLGDGTLVSYSLSLPTADSFSQTVGVFEPKIVSLGNRALKLEKIETSQGLLAVSAAGERPTIVYADSKRISYSSVAYKDVRSVATLYAAGQPAINAFAMPDSVQLAAVGALQKLDIRTMPLDGDQPLGITQDPSSRVFGVVTWAFLPRGTATKGIDTRGAVRILDQTDFVTLDEARLEPDERPNCIETVTLEGKQYLVVGTGFVRPELNETTSGRLIGYEIQTGRVRHAEERELKLAFEHKVRGNVYAIVGIQGRLAAAINSEVSIFEACRAPRLTLRQKGNWGCAFVACTLSLAEGNRLVVGDALRSMNVLEVTSESGKITEIARDCDPFWTTAAEMIDEKSQTLIGADIAFNLYTTQRVLLSDETKRRIKKAKEQEMESGRKVAPSSNALGEETGGYGHVMQRQAVFHYGDMINKFKKGSLVPTSGAGKVADPRILFCTAAGAIGVISYLDDQHAMLINQVERNILQILEEEGSGGGIPQAEWRTLRTDHRVQAPAGFIDGEIVQMFSNGRLDRAQRERVLNGPNSEIEKVDTERETVERVVEALSQLC